MHAKRVCSGYCRYFERIISHGGSIGKNNRPNLPPKCPWFLKTTRWKSAKNLGRKWQKVWFLRNMENTN